MKKFFIKNLLCFLLSFMYIEILFKILNFGFKFDFELFRILIFNITFSLLCTLIMTFLKPEKAKKITVLIILLFGLYAILQITFYKFMGNYISLNMVKDGNVTRIFNEIGEFLSTIKLYYFFFLVPFLILIFQDYETKKLEKKELLVVMAVMIVFHVLGLVTLLKTPNTQIKSNIDLYRNPNLVTLSLKEFGVNKFLYLDIKSLLFGNRVNQTIKIDDYDYENNRGIDDTEFRKLIESENNKIIKNLHEYYLNQSITPKNDYTGIFKNKNLILIMVESLDMVAINEQITPTLYKLYNSGWVFNNYYAPKYSCTTGESEFILETSIIPDTKACTLYAYTDNNYHTNMFNLFNNSNYQVSSFHSWVDQFYPRTQLHKNMGSNYYGPNELEIEAKDSDVWNSDIELIQKSYDIFKNYDKFMSFIITVSMHFPYTIDSDIVINNWDKVKDLDVSLKMKRYLAKAVEFDSALNYLVESLEKDGKLDDTVIVIAGDHYPYNLDVNELETLSDMSRKGIEADKIPMLIYNPNLKHEVINTTSSTFDLLPTLANLFDLDYDPRYYMGKDIFSEEEKIVIFSDGSWKTDNALYDAEKNTYEFLNDSINEDYIIKMNGIIYNKFIASDNTLKYDYYKYRFKEN